MEQSSIDHFVLGIHDLKTGMDEFEAKSGIAPVFGGVHEKVGTHNALVSLGEGKYLEILAPIDKNSRANSAFGDLNKETLTPVGWVIGTTNSSVIETILESHGIVHSGIIPLSRKTSQGNEIKWSNIFHHHEGKPSANPFFIEWEDLSIHPSITLPQHGCSLESFSINSQGEDQLTAFLKAIMLDLSFSKQTEFPSGQITSLSLNTPQGMLHFQA